MEFGKEILERLLEDKKGGREIKGRRIERMTEEETRRNEKK